MAKTRVHFNDFGGYELEGLDNCPAFVNHNMKATFPYIHYSNSYWNEARTVWGAEEKGLSYDYSDRLQEWDYKKAEAARKAADEKVKGFTPEWIQLYLSLYYGKDVELRHVMGGVNVSNGYNYYVYGYRIKDK